jgi:acyl dehydratase
MDAGGEMKQMETPVFYEDFELNQSLPPITRPPVDRVQLVRYAGASGDFNPLHYVDEVGQKAGTGGVIAHGMLIMGFAGQAVTRWVPNRYLRRLAVRFTGMTRPGDKITVTGRVVEKRIENGCGLVVGEVIATDEKGEVKLKGSFEAALPLKSTPL